MWHVGLGVYQIGDFIRKCIVGAGVARVPTVTSTMTFANEIYQTKSMKDPNKQGTVSQTGSRIVIPSMHTPQAQSKVTNKFKNHTLIKEIAWLSSTRFWQNLTDYAGIEVF